MAHLLRWSIGHRILRTSSRLSAGTCVNGDDANGNLSSKTDAHGITLNYKYHGLNRMTAKSSSDGTLNYAYSYDGSDGNGER